MSVAAPDLVLVRRRCPRARLPANESLRVFPLVEGTCKALAWSPCFRRARHCITGCLCRHGSGRSDQEGVHCVQAPVWRRRSFPYHLLLFLYAAFSLLGSVRDLLSRVPCGRLFFPGKGFGPCWIGERAKEDATNHAMARAQFARGEIRVLNTDGFVRLIDFI